MINMIQDMYSLSDIGYYRDNNEDAFYSASIKTNNDGYE